MSVRASLPEGFSALIQSYSCRISRKDPSKRNESSQIINGYAAFSLAVIIFSVISHSQPVFNVRVGFNMEGMEVEPGGTFTLRLEILEGGSLVRAGEFNISYTSGVLELLNVTPVNEWAVTKVGTTYLFYTLKVQPNRTAVAELRFKYSQDAPAQITLLYFKAADAQGNDLQVSVEPATVTVKARVVEQPQEGGAGPRPGSNVSKERKLSTTWVVFVMLTIISAVVVVAVARYLNLGETEAYSLIDRSGRVVFRTSSRDKIYGREDFVGIVPSDRLIYITRRSGGGQFRIVRGRDGWYIIDSYSTNPTLVNGVPIKGRGYVKLRKGDLISLRNVFELFFQGD